MKIIELIGSIISFAVVIYLIYLFSKKHKELKREITDLKWKLEGTEDKARINGELLNQLIIETNKKVIYSKRPVSMFSAFSRPKFDPEIVNLTEREKKIKELREQIKELEREEECNESKEQSKSKKS